MSANAPQLPGIDARPHEPKVAAWYAALATMAGRETAGTAAASRETALVVPALAEAFPAEAFNQRSLHHVAALTKRWGYATIHDALRQWWAENQPARHLVDTPDTADLDETEKGWVRFWRSRRPEAAAKEQDIRERGVWTDAHQLPLARLASLVRTYCPRAWAHISGELGTLQRREPTEAESEAVRRLTAEAIEATKMATPPRSPSVSAQLRSIGAQVQREHDRPMGGLSPERLAAEREALGIRSSNAPAQAPQPHPAADLADELFDDEEPPPPTSEGDYA